MRKEIQSLQSKISYKKQHVDELQKLKFNQKEYALGEIFDLANRGFLGAKLCLAKLYLAGEYVEVDKPFSLDILKSSFEEILTAPADVVYSTGLLFDICGDYERSIQLYSSALNNNYPPAISRLAVMYREGIGVQKNEAVFKKEILRASNLGHVRSKSLYAIYLIKTGTIFEKAKGIYIYGVNIPAALYYAIFRTQEKKRYI